LIKYFSIHAVFTIINFFIWVFNNGEPSGADAMTPLLVIFVVSIQFCLGTLLVLLLKKKVQYRIQRLAGLILYAISYELIFLFFTSRPPILNITFEGFYGEVSKAYSLSSFVALIIVLLMFSVNEYRKRETSL
tara:strand:+ start:1560 stop:1958 length:399 start_codon:yes stop_codon:yes gene_type:complete